jgi:hypothetical protein
MSGRSHGGYIENDGPRSRREGEISCFFLVPSFCASHQLNSARSHQTWELETYSRLLDITPLRYREDHEKVKNVSDTNSPGTGTYRMLPDTKHLTEESLEPCPFLPWDQES